MTKTVAVRLEGGLGDHILGLRIMNFIKRRLPVHEIVVYSDSEGGQSQLEVVKMCPLVSRVVPIFKDMPAINMAMLGDLTNVRQEDLNRMHTADAFFDTRVRSCFVGEARTLGVSHFEMLGARPSIVVPEDAVIAAMGITGSSKRNKCIAICFAKYGVKALQTFLPILERIVSRALEDDEIRVFNLFTSQQRFSHWPEPERSLREQAASDLSTALASLASRSPRQIINVADKRIDVVAALLQRSCYFVGLDNGIRHLAWALGCKYSYILPRRPSQEYVLTWAPDYHRAMFLEEVILNPSCLMNELDRALSGM